MQPPLLSSPTLKRLLGDGGLVIVDGGARGDLPPPLAQIPADQRLIVRFEPDADVGVVQGPGELVLRQALWSEPETIVLHVTAQPSCSSIYPPDLALLANYVDILGVGGRRVERQIPVPATSIDYALAGSELGLPDFIKLDIHGAEYEALLGASQALADATVGVLVECWPVPIHRGQHSFAELDTLLQAAGFQPFDTAVGAWPHKPVSSRRYRSRPQSVQFELLYLLAPADDAISTYSTRRAAALIAVAELFGHVTYAAAIAKAAALHDVISRTDADVLTSTALARNRISAPRFLMSACARRLSAALEPFIVSVAGR